MLDLQDMDYWADASCNAEGDFNERYTGRMPNGDVVELSRNGWANRNWWTWMAYRAKNFPVQSFLWSSNKYRLHSPEEALEDFLARYREHAFESIPCEPVYYRCLSCGWEGVGDDIGRKTVYEDFGDVDCLVCPGCGRVEYEGDELLVEIG